MRVRPPHQLCGGQRIIHGGNGVPGANVLEVLLGQDACLDFDGRCQGAASAHTNPDAERGLDVPVVRTDRHARERRLSRACREADRQVHVCARLRASY